MTNFLCDVCGQPFENGKVKSNHVRWKHGNIEKYKESNRKATIKFLNKKLGKFQIFQVKCFKCKNPFDVTERKNQFPKKDKYFCSKLCSSTYSQKHVNKECHHKSMVEFGKLLKKEPKSYDLICVVCKKSFQKILNNWTFKNKPNKTCSNICFRKLTSKNSRENPNCGGETNYKRYRYKDILMDSKWEVDLAKWMDERKIIWDRSRKRHQLFWFDEIGNNRRYYPDFYIPKINVYIDPKNPYLMKCDKYKIQKVMERNNVEVVCGNLDVLKKTLSERCL